MIRVQEDIFDAAGEIDALIAGRKDIGAVVTFVGYVRGVSHVRGDSNGEPITAMTLEHYPGMTEAKLDDIERRARARWPLDACLIVHRVGRMLPGEPIVLVVTASAHRRAAFEAAEFLVDWLKTRAPFWKREETAAGDRWVEARNEDQDAARRW